MSIVKLLMVIIMFAGCLGDEPLEQLYPSRGMYEPGTELTLLTDEHNVVSIITLPLVILRVIGEEEKPHRILIRYKKSGDAHHITGYDPNGIYAPFSFFGTTEELFGISPEESIEADIKMVTIASRATYELENLTFCRVGN